MPALGAIVIGEKRETPLVANLQQNRPRPRLAGGIDARHRHRIGLEQLPFDGLGEPEIELLDRVGIEFAPAQAALGIILPESGEFGWGEHGRVCLTMVSICLI